MKRLITIGILLFLLINCDTSKNPLTYSSAEPNKAQIKDMFIENIIKSPDQGYLITGTDNSSHQYKIKKLNEDFSITWSQTLTPPGNNRFRYPPAIKYCNDKTILAATAYDSTLIYIKYDNMGNKIWQKNHKLEDECTFVADIIESNNDEYILFCQYRGKAYHPTEPGYYYTNFNQNLLFAINGLGEKQWSNTVYKFDLGGLYTRKIFKYHSGYIIVNMRIDAADDLVIFRTDFQGNLKDHQIIGCKTLDFADYSENCGLVLGTNIRWYSAMNNFQIKTLDTNNNLIWETVSDSHYRGADAVIDSHDNIYVLGNFIDCDNATLCQPKQSNLWLAVFNPLGEKMIDWIDYENSNTFAQKLILNNDGSLTICGYTVFIENGFQKTESFLLRKANILN